MSTSEMPLVSVVIPVYNRPEVIKTIESIIRQTYKQLEIIIVDNASSDSTPDVIRKIKDSRIVFVRNQENMGQTFSMNRGFGLAKGKYIARIDSDDIALPNRIEEQVDYMEKNTECVICGSYVKIMDDHEKLLWDLSCCRYDNGIRLNLLFGCPFFHPAVMIRRDVIAENNLEYNSDYHYAEDYELWSKVLKYGKGYNIPNVLTYYCRGAGNDSRIHADVMKAESYSIQKSVRESIDDIELRTKMIDSLEVERGNSKSVRQCMVVLGAYRMALKRTIKKDDPDYNSVRRQITKKLFFTLVDDNSKIWAVCINKSIRFAKGFMERHK